MHNNAQNLVRHSCCETHLLFLQGCETFVKSFTFLNDVSPSKVLCAASPVPTVSNEFKLNYFSSVTCADRRSSR